MKISIFLLALLFSSLNVFCQETITTVPIDSLSLDNYVETPTYIINDNYVIYEMGKTRKIIYADIPSFKIPRYPDYSGIALDKNGIYFRGALVTADTAGFRILGRSIDTPVTWLWKNKNKVYKNETELPGIDAVSFQPIDGRYLKDKDHLYYFDKKIENSDPATLKNSYDGVCYDKNNVYIHGKIAYANNGEKYYAVNDWLMKTKTEVVILNVIWRYNISGAIDPASLKGLSRYYSVDKYHAYFQTIALPITPDRFKYIKVWDQVNRAYISDGIHVYFGSNLEPDFDAKSFGMFPKSDFCYDKNGCYQRKWLEKEKIVVNEKFPFKYSKPVSEQTVLRIGLQYYIYEHQVYDPWADKLYTNVSDQQLSELKSGMRYIEWEKEPVNDYGEGLYKLNSKFYYKGVEIKDIDAASFASHDYGYADKNHIYSDFRNGYFQIVPGADPETFKTFINGFCRDKKDLYYGGYPLISSKSIELLAIFWGRHTRHGDEGDAGPPDFDRYLFKNTKGYWLITNESKPRIDYLGTQFDQKWTKGFARFELPRGL